MPRSRRSPIAGGGARRLRKKSIGGGSLAHVARGSAYVLLVTYGWRRLDADTVELCDECGFDSRRVLNVTTDVRSTIETMRLLLGDPDADRRPGPETWSASEYAVHTIAVVTECCQEVADAAGLELGEPPTTCEEAETYVADLHSAIADDALEQIALDAPFGELTGTGNLLHALHDAQHDAQHHVLDIRRNYAGLALASGEALSGMEAPG